MTNWKEEFRKKIKAKREKLDGVEQRIKEIEDIEKELKDRFMIVGDEENEKRLYELRDLFKTKIEEFIETLPMRSPVDLNIYLRGNYQYLNGAFNFRYFELEKGRDIEEIKRTCGL